MQKKFVTGLVYETYNSKEVKKKESQKEAKADIEMEEQEVQEALVPLATHVNNILDLIFSNVEVYINLNKLTNQMDCMRTSHTFPTSSSQPFLKTRGFCIARGTTMKKIPDDILEASLFELFSTKRMKTLSRPGVSCCMASWGLIFCPLLNCYIQP